MAEYSKIMEYLFFNVTKLEVEFFQMEERMMKIMERTEMENLKSI